MVNGFVLDYLHLVCVGVMKRLLNWYMPSTKVSKIPKKIRMSKKNLENFDHKLELFEKAIPSEFNRRLEGGRGSLNYWKATEFRCFTLYAGVITLRDCLSFAQYTNYLELACAMRLLLVDGSDPREIEKLLRTFF